MHHRLVTRYDTVSSEAADANEAAIRSVFDELVDAGPGGVGYLVLRLSDGSFLHVSFHDHGYDDPNPIAALPAFQEFLAAHPGRRSGPVVQMEAELVGAYLPVVD